MRPRLLGSIRATRALAIFAALLPLGLPEHSRFLHEEFLVMAKVPRLALELQPRRQPLSQGLAPSAVLHFALQRAVAVGHLQ